MRADRAYRPNDDMRPEARLSALGVPWPLVVDALQQGRAVYRGHTALDIPSAQGTATLSKIVRRFSESFAEDCNAAYRRVVNHNQVTFVKNDESEQFVVFTGNVHTGHEERLPTAISDKGLMTREKIEANCSLLHIGSDRYLFEDTLDAVELPNPKRILTRAFMFHICPDGKIQSELSVPVEFENRGPKIHITRFVDRIILPVINPESEIEITDDGSSPDDFDFPVIRKA